MAEIKQSPYLPKQMNGSLVNGVMQTLDGRLSEADSIIDYLYNLSIESAQQTELENIGCIVGYPRPLVPEGFESENVFILTSLPMEQDISIGFSAVLGEIGGRLTSIETSDTGYMELGMYRKFLDKVAYIKRYGVTLYSVDKIAELIDDDYTIEYTENADLQVTFAKNIGFKNVWILTNLFYRLATEPQIIIISGSD